MPASRREFLGQLAALGALPDLIPDALAAPALPVTTASVGASQEEEADSQYLQNVRLYYVENSASLVASAHDWIEKAEVAEIRHTQTLLAAAWEAESTLELERARLLDREGELAYLEWLRDHGAGMQDVKKEHIDAARREVHEAQALVQQSEGRIREQTQTLKSSGFEKALPQLKSSVERRLTPALTWDPPVSDIITADSIDVALFSLHTSNGSRDNRMPWDNHRDKKDLGLLSVGARYFVPANPTCNLPAKTAESALAQTIRAGGDQHATGVQVMRIFHKLPVKASGEVEFFFHLIDLFDPNDRDFWDKLASTVLEVVDFLKGLSFADSLGLGAIGPVAEVVEKLEEYAKKNNRNKKVWDRSISSNSPLLFARAGGVATHPLRQGLYVLADESEDLTGALLEDRTWSVQNGNSQPKVNYLVFGISRAA